MAEQKTEKKEKAKEQTAKMRSEAKPVKAKKEKVATKRSPEGEKKEVIETKEVKHEEKKEIKQEDKEEQKQTSLVETDKYLNTGAHIGTKFKSGDMRRYIYKVRKDGLNVLDVQTLDERLMFAAKFIANYQGEKVVVVSRKVYGQTPAKTFAEAIGATIITGRFIPGTFTNPESHRFIEPSIVIVTDPEADAQAIKEATRVRVPVVGMASTNNSLRNLDLAVPINNKGKKSLALGFWILAKEVLKERGDIKNDDAFSKKPEDFEYKMKEGEDEDKKGFAKKKWKSFAQSRPPFRRGRR